MQLKLKSVKLFCFYVLLFGLFSCNKDNTNSQSQDPQIKQSNINEIKIKGPYFIRNGAEAEPLIQLIQKPIDMTVTDLLDFNEFEVKTSEADVYLNWNSDCESHQKIYRDQGLTKIPYRFQVSELLSTDLFFNESAKDFEKAECQFVFELKQRETEATHKFTVQATVRNIQENNLKLYKPQSLIEVGSNGGIEAVYGAYLYNYEVRTDGYPISLYCEKSISHLQLARFNPYKFEFSHYKWISPSVVSENPFFEYPHQICRMFAQKSGHILMWSNYFELRSPYPKPDVIWHRSNLQQSIVYEASSQNIFHGQLTLKNNSPSPQVFNVPKSMGVDVIPFCQSSVSSTLKLQSFARILDLSVYQILSEDNYTWTINIPSNQTTVINYEFNPTIQCDCRGAKKTDSIYSIGYLISTTRDQDFYVNHVSQKLGSDKWNAVIGRYSIAKNDELEWIVPTINGFPLTPLTSAPSLQSTKHIPNQCIVSK